MSIQALSSTPNRNEETHSELPVNQVPNQWHCSQPNLFVVYSLAEFLYITKDLHIPASCPMSPHSSSSSPADDLSESSSVVYQHEPFATFSSRVLDLALSLWPESASSSFSIERLQGGSSNGIIGLTRQGAYPSFTTDAEYIIRIPRFDATRVDYEVTVIRLSPSLTLSSLT